MECRAAGGTGLSPDAAAMILHDRPADRHYNAHPLVLVVTNGWNNFAATSSGNPGPVLNGKLDRITITGCDVKS